MEINTEQEIWRDIVGYEGLYQVSNMGRVKSLDRFVNGKGGISRMKYGRFLKISCQTANNYCRQFVTLSQNGIVRPILISRLVAINFLSNLPNYSHVHHKDNNNQNNNVNNLEWKDVTKHIVGHGLFRRKNLIIVSDPNYTKPTQFKPLIDNEAEIWLPIKGFENYYQISNFGRIRKIAGKVKNKNGKGLCFVTEPILLSIGHTPKGYETRSLTSPGRANVFFIHRLVAQHFLLNLNNFPLVHHKDGNRLNNFAENLEWISREKHKQIHQNHYYKQRGLENKNSKLNPDIVKEIRRLATGGDLSMAKIGGIFGVTDTTVSQILHGKTWNYVT